MTLAFSFSPWVVNLAYVVAAVLFIVGIRRLASPRTARSGNWIAAVGMAVAVVFTLTLAEVDRYIFVTAGIAVGVAIGLPVARRIQMTAMPQMVALLNGLGGGAAALVAAAEFHRIVAAAESPAADTLVATLGSALLGPLTFSGSVLAFAKLQELMPGRPLVFPGQQLVNATVFAGALALAALTAVTENEAWLVIAIALSFVFGILLVLPIGGADMPVVIALLNAFSGLGGVTTGFVLDNNALIIGGTLVGASGTLLTILMGRAMNRSLANVLFGAFGAAPTGPAPAAAETGDGMVRETTAEDAAVMLAYARQVVVVPGYGLAVAQAQHATRELADLLEARGVKVKYAIHPVAGRMPGHMNVLLAEASVPYPQLYDMDDANPEFPRTDVALVIGANDVTNPAARANRDSPLYGMPILDVDQAANVIVLKRSMNPGFAGIENELYYNPKTAMLFGDAKASVEKLIAGIKSS
ncbi:MAG: NAD(P)(+) transhydrogenase (Re/Si-specific) subunit beta [Actinomycetota bacterium]|nr:NAD(P)(+) transhydrogenase (Re/Si-specific) subunit beta [Actinomycetota bacterium]